jgi:hypothetical protein
MRPDHECIFILLGGCGTGAHEESARSVNSLAGPALLREAAAIRTMSAVPVWADLGQNVFRCRKTPLGRLLVENEP